MNDLSKEEIEKLRLEEFKTDIESLKEDIRVIKLELIRLRNHITNIYKDM